MTKIVFSSDELPSHLDDDARFALWRDLFVSINGSFDLERLPDRPFSARHEFIMFGEVGVAQFNGTLRRMARDAQQASSGPDKYCFALNQGAPVTVTTKRGRENTVEGKAGILMTNAEAGEVLAREPGNWRNIYIARRRLRDLVANADDLLSARLAPDNPALQHLQLYLNLVFEPGAVNGDPTIAEHVGTTLADLIALTLGTNRDLSEIARARGLRAVRLEAVLADLKQNFSDPALTPASVARRLGLSPRYVQNLLWETGISFTQRVLELRLQATRRMLTAAAHDRLKVSDIALACGFNEVSYFNRRFRARFGVPPSSYRGGG